MYPDSPRYVNSNAYQHNHANEHDGRFPEEKSSVESVAEAEDTGVNKNNLRDYPDESVYVKILPKHNLSALREGYQRSDNYGDYNAPDTITAIQRLQRLKELQMKRDISERYYSQEIKRLIGEYYFGPKIASPSWRPTTRLRSASFPQSTENRLKNVANALLLIYIALEPCGTMTTIMRLDCGCSQKTTRPIFTTTEGRIQSRSCNLSQDERLLKVTSSNPQEHLFLSLEQSKDRYRAKTKKRLDSRTGSKIPPVGDQEFETENEKKDEEPEQEIIEHISRTTSPQRKFSNTSAISYENVNLFSI
ncbi:hypothetical protein WN48_10396 [Eufriesea mexicana]|nr:hypothetical protein WN48_10396 [Eufriesea mexicana]